MENEKNLLLHHSHLNMCYCSGLAPERLGGNRRDRLLGWRLIGEGRDGAATEDGG